MTMNFAKTLSKIMFLLFILTLPQNVSAEKTDWKDNNFNFETVQTVAIKNIDFGPAPSQQILRKTLLDNLSKGATKLRKIKIVDENSPADVIIQTKIKTWHNSFYIVPERTTWEKRTFYRTIRRSDGTQYEESYDTVVPVTYPPYRVDVSDLVVNFEVYDAKTGKMVFGREDDRSRNDLEAQKNMFGRMCNSFFSDFKKVLGK